MESATIGDYLAETTRHLESAIDTEGYDTLSARDRAYLQEALYYLETVQEDSSGQRSNADAPNVVESQ
jgi:hypothetical protein